MAAKRAYGQGSIYQRADGRWAGMLVIDSGPPLRRKWVYATSRREVERKLAEAREKEAVRSGFERLDPTKLPGKVKKADPVSA